VIFTSPLEGSEVHCDRRVRIVCPLAHVNKDQLSLTNPRDEIFGIRTLESLGNCAALFA